MQNKIVILGNKFISEKCFIYLINNLKMLNSTIQYYIYNEKYKEENQKLIDICSINNINTSSSLDAINSIPNIDYLISVNYYSIIPKLILNKVKKISINLHMGPLPEYRGCNQFSFAIVNDAKEFGVTIHKIDSGIDTGDILFEKRFEIPEEIYVNDLYKMAEYYSCELFIQNISKVLYGDYSLISQGSISNRVSRTYYRKDINKLKIIDINWSSDKILKHIRATSMPGFEPPYFIRNNKKHYITAKDLKK